MNSVRALEPVGDEEQGWEDERRMREERSWVLAKGARLLRLLRLLWLLCPVWIEEGGREARRKKAGDTKRVKNLFELGSRPHACEQDTVTHAHATPPHALHCRSGLLTLTAGLPESHCSHLDSFYIGHPIA